MKKLMTVAAAALCATVGFAAGISSQNVVGYNKVALNAGGKNMVGACFIKPGTTDTIRLTELKIVGYEGSPYYLENVCEFTASFQRRASNGAPYAEYAYTDTTSDCVTWDGGKWFNLETGDVITAEDDVLLVAGDGLWFDTPALEDCEGFYLQSSGAVLNGAHGFRLNAGGKIGACNMMPKDTTLTKVEIHGYENSLYYLESVCEFTVSMQTLGSNGAPLAEYAYTDTTSDCVVWDGGIWFNLATGEKITEANDKSVLSGEGFWVDAPALEDCTEFIMVFPACL